MRVLLSCVNSLVSLIGYDTEKGKAFWYCPSNILRACGACYHDNALCIASDDFVTFVEPDGLRQIRLPGQHHSYAHSVHSQGDGVAVADTGNSLIRVFSPSGMELFAYAPTEGWPEHPPDPIHLNDFTETSHGLVASCFAHRPLVKDYVNFDWRDKGHGLILELNRHRKRDASRVVGCGLSCPHTLVWHDDALYCCASGESRFIRMERSILGTYCPTHAWTISSDHFIRGALRVDNGWLIGGSSKRHTSGPDSAMTLFHFDDKGNITSHFVAKNGEIYDIMPWRDDIMRPLAANVINRLPVQEWDDQDYPPVCPLED